MQSNVHPGDGLGMIDNLNHVVIVPFTVPGE